MTRMLRRVWDDDRGAVVSTELVLVLGILVFGLIAGFVALRNSTIAALGTVGNTLSTIVPSFTFSGFSIGNAFGGRTIAQVQGYQFQTVTTQYLTGYQVSPIYLGTIASISPAP